MPLKCIDVGQLKVFTNNRCLAEHIKGGTVENVASGVQIEESGKVGEKEHSKGNVMNVQIIPKPNEEKNDREE